MSTIHVGSGEPCPRCAAGYGAGWMRREWVMPLPSGVGVAPLAHDGSGPCCHDCAAADSVLRRKMAPGWAAARTAVGNDRAEQLRLPGAPLGLVHDGTMRPSAPGDLDRHHDWLDEEYPIPDWMRA